MAMVRKQREMTYHYAGKVHVRGLLRRVWRPRYLALGDDGYLRYHESIPPLFQQDPHRRQPHGPYSMSMSHGGAYGVHNTHRPKLILAVLDGARVINPYSVADRHVALPQGVYGFVFRGRPVELRASEPHGVEGGASSSDAEQGALIVPPTGHGADRCGEASPGTPGNSHKHSKKAAVVNLVFPKGTSRRRTAQKIAKQALNPDVLCGFSRPSNCEGGISRSSSSSSLVGYEQPLGEGGSGHEDLDNIYQPYNHEWGLDSHESHGTMGSFQEVDPSHVSRDLNDSLPHTNYLRRMPNASPKATVKVTVQASSIQSREYLCAVSTAEEAESWVVALRWAAEHRRTKRYRSFAAVDQNTTQGVSARGDSLPETPLTYSRSAVIEEQMSALLNTGPASEGNSIFGDEIPTESEKDSDADAGGQRPTRRRNDSGGGNGGFDCSAGKEIYGGDSKASLSSLLIEHDGWCKAEEVKKKEATEGNGEEREGSEISSDAPPPGIGSVQTSTKDESQRAKLEASLSSTCQKKHTIVVTKVRRFQLPQSALAEWYREGFCDGTCIPWFPLYLPLPWDQLVLRYEIQLLLLRNCKPLDTASVQPEFVEERTIHKSMYDVLELVRALMAEFGAAEHEGFSCEGSESDQPTPRRKGATDPTLYPDQTLNLLDNVESDLLTCLQPSSSVRRKFMVDEGPLPNTQTEKNDLSSEVSYAMASIDIINDLMRKLSKDSSICSSHHFQKFLGLNTLHGQSVFGSTTSTVRSVPRGADAEQIVKLWLAEVGQPSNMSRFQLFLGIVLRHKLYGPLLSLTIIWSTTSLVSFLWSILSGTRIIVTIPFETYSTLIALSFFLGHNNGISSHMQHYEKVCEGQPRKLPTSTDAVELEGETLHKEAIAVTDDDHSTIAEEGEPESDEEVFITESSALSSPLPMFPANHGISCWSKPDHRIFMVRGPTYLENRVKMPSAPAVFQCRGVDVWITDNAERNISRHPSVLGGKLDQEDTFIINFLLPFSNFVAYFTVPPIKEMPANIADVWTKFIKGDQQYRDGKLKLLPVVVDGPWIVKKAVGPGTSPAMIGRDLPLQYYFTEPTDNRKGVYEVDVLVTASRIARGILNVVKGHTKSLSIAFAFIIEASTKAQLPETVLCAFQVHSLHLEDCPNLPDCYPDG